MRSTSTASEPLSELFEIYDRDVLSKGVIGGVLEKEKTREYPLDRLNDMRALINYGPEFGAQCITHHEHLVSVATIPERMSVGRLLRIHMALMCTLGTLGRLGSSETLPLRQLSADLGGVLVQRVRNERLTEDMSVLVHPERVPAQVGAASKHALNIAWKCGELADRLGMGEHVIHAHSHVEIAGRERTIRRGFFYQRRNHYFPFRVVIGTVLTPDSDYVLSVPLFRARARDVIPPQDRDYFEVVVEGEALTDVSALQHVDALVTSALQSVCAHEERVPSALDLDVRKMLIYSAELRDANRAQGKIWRLTETAYEEIAQRKMTRRLGLEDEEEFGRVFFDLIREGLNSLRNGLREFTT
ncbi:MAG TPA: hypothetical protein VM537_12405 [Anaerolineae bacterium]|nr:hypothetical protein [Anaerolineae bacterium]